MSNFNRSQQGRAPLRRLRGRERTLCRFLWRGRGQPLPRPVVMVIAVCLLLGAAVVPCSAVELLTNGNFETGTFAGWTHVNMGDVDFFIDTPGTKTPPAPPSNTEFDTAANPLGGNFYAVSTQDLPGTNALIQDFIVPVLSPTDVVTLSFQMFVNDQSGLGPADGAPFIDPSGLDHTTGGTFDNNQHARVDLLRDGAGDFSTAPLDVLGNFYLGVDNPGGTLPNPYTSYSFNITPLVSGGGTFRLRFADVENISALNVGVDNASVQVTPAAIPEPGTLTLLLVGAVTGAAWLRRKKR